MCILYEYSRLYNMLLFKHFTVSLTVRTINGLRSIICTYYSGIKNVNTAINYLW
jgi:hypothetical protein